jgi:PAS domain S-box-containing protein
MEDDFITIILIDIDETKKLQIKLQQSEKKLKMAVNAAKEAIFEYDVKNDLAILDDSAWTMLGYDPNPVEQSMLYWKSLMHPVDRKRFLLVERKLYQGEMDSFSVLIRFRTKQGDYKWIEVIGEVVQRDFDNSPIKIIGVRRDIDERKKIEENKM